MERKQIYFKKEKGVEKELDLKLKKIKKRNIVDMDGIQLIELLPKNVEEFSLAVTVLNYFEVDYEVVTMGNVFNVPKIKVVSQTEQYEKEIACSLKNGLEDPIELIKAVDIYTIVQESENPVDEISEYLKEHTTFLDEIFFVL